MPSKPMALPPKECDVVTETLTLTAGQKAAQTRRRNRDAALQAARAPEPQQGVRRLNQPIEVHYIVHTAPHKCRKTYVDHGIYEGKDFDTQRELKEMLGEGEETVCCGKRVAIQRIEFENGTCAVQGQVGLGDDNPTS